MFGMKKKPIVLEFAACGGCTGHTNNCTKVSPEEFVKKYGKVYGLDKLNPKAPDYNEKVKKVLAIHLNNDT